MFRWCPAARRRRKGAGRGIRGTGPGVGIVRVGQQRGPQGVVAFLFCLLHDIGLGGWPSSAVGGSRKLGQAGLCIFFRIFSHFFFRPESGAHFFKTSKPRMLKVFFFLFFPETEKTRSVWASVFCLSVVVAMAPPQGGRLQFSQMCKYPTPDVLRIYEKKILVCFYRQHVRARAAHASRSLRSWA